MILRQQYTPLRILAKSPLPPRPCHIYQSRLQARIVFFSTTSFHYDNTPTHYDILKVSPNATQADLKKQFYVLSKETHPDVRHDDPHAGERFAQISESYSILADPEKRKKYDRDVMGRIRRDGGPRNSSGAQGTYAGSRPATGLSKRRSAFRGPPPSYYAHGNPTASSARQADANKTQSDFSNAGGTFNAAGFTPDGQYDPAFDSTGVYRTQTHEDARRQSRRAAAMAEAQEQAELEGNFWARFVIVSSIVIFGVTFASVLAGSSNNPKGGLTRGDGSRRTSKNDLNKA